MATPKKKHLIELMIEAGVKWPDGAEYAAQDKRNGKLYFFKMKPRVRHGDEHFCAPGGSMGYPYSLPSLCRNWHETIVTREQYAEAVSAAATMTPAAQQEAQPAPKYCASVMRQMPNNTIEQLTSDYHTKAAEADRLQSVADEALKAADEALLALEKAGELLGLVISIDTKQKLVEPPVEPEQPVITDWHDLRVGDVIKVKGKFWEDDEEYTVTIQDGSRMPVFVGGYWAESSKDEFKFIRRP